MLQGQLTVPWYTSFNCNRALSIRTVGIEMEPVFLRIPPGLKAYDGFSRPQEDILSSNEATGVKFARMTTKNLYSTLRHKAYLDRLQESGDELQLHRSLMDVCNRQNMTISEFVFSGGLKNR